MSKEKFNKIDVKTLLYHYTSINSFNEITKSKSLWMSDCRFLNDKKELLIAIDKFLSYFNNEDKEHLFNIIWNSNYTKYFCIFSMSKSPEVLSQWRGYGDDGKGICIGFRKEFLELIFYKDKDSRDIFIIDCIYDNIDDHIDRIIQENKENIKKIIDGFKNRPLNDLYGHKIWDEHPELSGIYRELLRIKNPSFKEEQEVRIVKVTPKESIKRRVCNGLIIPYTELDISDNSTPESIQYIMHDLWLGPKCDERNMDAIRSYGHLGWGLNLYTFDCGYI